MTTTKNIVTNGLLMHLDAARATGELSGNNSPATKVWKDISGNGLDGVLSDNFAYTADCGWNDDALVFKKGNYVEIAGDGKQNFANQTFTIEVWSKHLFQDGKTFFSYDPKDISLNNYYCAHFRTSGEMLYFGFNINKEFRAFNVKLPDDLDRNQYHQFVCTFTTAKQSIYVNGKELATQEPKKIGEIDYAATPVRIGTSTSGGNNVRFEGKLRTIRYYKRALTADEIAQNYQVETAIIEPPEQLPEGLPEKFINVRSYGAIGNGLNDDTSVLQQAVDAAAGTDHKNVFIPAGVFMVNVLQSLKLRDGISLYMTDNTMLKAIKNERRFTVVLKIENVENVNVYGGVVCGDRDEHIIPEQDIKDNYTHEHGMGVVISGAKNIVIRNTIAEKCMGDGFYIGTENFFNGSTDGTLHSVPCNIELIDIEARNNRRQGITLVAGRDIEIIRPVLRETHGTDPQAGIDIEPCSATDIIENVHLIDAKTINNKGAGVQVYLQNLEGAKVPATVTITNHTDDGSKYGMYIVRGRDSAKIAEGLVSIHGGNWGNSYHNGLLILNHDQRAFRVDVNDAHIINPARYLENPINKPSGNGIEEAAIAIYVQKDEELKVYHTDNPGNIRIRKPIIEDNGEKVLTTGAFHFWHPTAANFDIKIYDPKVGEGVPVHQNTEQYIKKTK